LSSFRHAFCRYTRQEITTAIAMRFTARPAPEALDPAPGNYFLAKRDQLAPPCFASQGVAEVMQAANEGYAILAAELRLTPAAEPDGHLFILGMHNANDGFSGAPDRSRA
jgi:hypothetical protein